METDLIIFFRDLIGKGNISIFGDNAKLFNDKNSAEHIIWDDAGESLYAVRLNENNRTYEKEPVSLICLSYGTIQYLSTTLNLEKLKTILEALKAKGIPCDIEKICNDMQEAYEYKVTV